MERLKREKADLFREITNMEREDMLSRKYEEYIEKITPRNAFSKCVQNLHKVFHQSKKRPAS